MRPLRVGIQHQHTDVHVSSPSNFIAIEQSKERSEQAPYFIDCGIECLHG